MRAGRMGRGEEAMGATAWFGGEVGLGNPLGQSKRCQLQTSKRPPGGHRRAIERTSRGGSAEPKEPLSVRLIGGA